jgi:hypothetical protein
MTKPMYNPFHFRAISWLREKMLLNTRRGPTDVLADEGEQSRTRLDGYVLPGDYRSVLGYLALMVLLCAGTLAMISGRSGLSPTLTHALQFSALGMAVASVLMLVVDNVREHHYRRPVDVVVLARSSETAEVDADRLARWHANAHGQLWVVSELGFTADALAAARAREVRCFALHKHCIEEVSR